MEKVDKILKTYYNQYKEENRFKKSNHNRLEFITTTKYIEKYLKGVADIPTENRLRILRLLENLCLGTAAVGYLTESMHGAGSPQAQRIMIARQSDLSSKKDLAKNLAGID